MVVELGKCINFKDLYKTPYFGKHISKGEKHIKEPLVL